MISESGTTITFGTPKSYNQILELIKILHRGRKIHMAVSAIPSAGNGEDEVAYALYFLKRGIPVVTSGKAGLANQYERLRPYLHLYHHEASVGGAVMILDELRRHLRIDRGWDSVVHLVANGTLSYGQANLSRNRSGDTTVREMVKLGFAEPQQNGRMPSQLELYRGENDDLEKKVRIVLQDIYGPIIGRPLKPKDIKRKMLTAKALFRFTAPNKRYKYLIRISTTSALSEIDTNAPGSMRASFGRRLFVSAGFVEVPKGTAYDVWVPDEGPGNALHIDQAGTQRIVAADGAGDLATVGTMRKDMLAACPLY